MVRHVILWKLKDGFSDGEKQRICQNAKAGLEGLQGRIPGLRSIAVITDGLPTSNADMMLDSLFDDAAALAGYAAHPAHLDVANSNVRPFVQTRLCLDFEA